MEAQLKMIPPSRLTPSPTNPRKHPGDLTELVESVRSKGVIEPIVARPHPDANIQGIPADALEIVCGHRRSAAAEKAELATVPVIVRKLDDDQVLDLQLAENIDRADLSPLEEAEAYKLRLDRGQTVAHIAERIGRSPAYVAQRLQLLELAPACRDKLATGDLTLGVAMLIARIPGGKLQEDALDAVCDRWDGCVPLDIARERIESEYMLRLSEAPFDTASPDLVPKAGACTNCPKRTGNQAELFADVKSPDLCIDPTCHKTKVDAEWLRRKREARKTGLEVLDDKEADRALHGMSGYVKLTDKHYLPGGKSKSIKAILGKDAPPAAIARDKWNGKIVELVKRSDLDKALKAQGLLQDKPATARSATVSAFERKQKIRRKAVDRVVERAVERASWLAPEDVLGLVVRAFAARVWSDTQERVLKRRGIDHTKHVAKGATSKVEAAITQLARNVGPGGDLEGLGLELAIVSAAPSVHHNGMSSVWSDAMRVLGLDFAKLEAEVAAELKAKKNGQNPKKKKPTKPATSAKARASAGRNGKTSKPTASARAASAGSRSKPKQRRAATPPADEAPPVDDFGNEEHPLDVCRGCGCTELDPCPGGCAWAEPGLCTNCVGPAPKGRKKASPGDRAKWNGRNPSKPGRKARRAEAG